MSINITLPDAGPNLRPTITVMGIGGAGGNAINNMISSNLEGVDFLIANTDAQSLSNSSCERKIQLGLKSTKGLGAGMRPDVGRQAAEEVIDELKEKLNGSHMIFIAAGMGGGTGTGAAPVIAQLAREMGILTVGVVTKPFHFEGTQRMKLAEGGIEELQQHVDTLITIPNQNLFRIANEKTTFSDAFKMADDVLYAGVRGVTDLMVQPGMINLDFSDIKTVMSEMGKAMMGTAQAEGEGRAIDAAERAIANPLIDDVSLKGAKGLIINITGGNDLTLYEVDEAANRIKQEVQEDANIIYGTTCDDRLEGVIRVSIVATGIDVNSAMNYKSLEKPASLFIDNSVYQSKIEEQQDVSSINNNMSVNDNTNDNTNDEAISSNESHLSDLSPDINQESNDFSLNSKSNEEDVSNFEEENTSSSIDEDHKLNIDNNDDIDAQENKSTIRKLSLFDTLNQPEEHSLEVSKHEDVSKNEPILDNSSENPVEESINVDEESGESDDNLSSEEFEPEEELLEDDDLNQEQEEQEEELLDIPTFLRRQAN